MPLLTRAGNKDKRLDMIAGFADVTKRRPASRKPNPPTPTPSIDLDENVESSKDLNNENDNLIRSIPSIIEVECQRKIKIFISAAKSRIRLIIHRRPTSVISEIQYIIFSSIENSVERNEIDKFDKFDEINRIKENKAEIIKEDALFNLLYKFQYKKEIVKIFFHNIKTVSSFDFVKWMSEAKMYMNQYTRWRKKLYLNSTIKTSAISTAPEI
jgi:hypothetical protein